MASHEPSQTSASATDQAEPDARPIVLVVDDSPDIRLLLSLTLSSYYRVVEARDGLHAFELMKADQHFDVAILDVMMPKVDGFTVARTIREARPDVPIIMLSAVDDDANRRRGADAGADRYYPKPFDPLHLRATLIALTHGVSRASDARSAMVDTRTGDHIDRRRPRGIRTSDLRPVGV